VAVKVIDKFAVQRLGDLKQVWRAIRRVDREVAVLRRFRHPHIVGFLDVRHGPDAVYLVMEYAEKDLYSVISQCAPLGVPTDEAQRVMKQLGSAVAHLHGHDICHLDLKPENVLLAGPSATVKLCDFGVAASCANGTRLTDFVGSCGFFAPELVLQNGYLQNGYDGRFADAWSFGVVLLELLIGSEKF
ncbi:kinase-like domain-containing protein, partial [Pelagophyceae sp. CCMP2097]